jgi:hypothetical protein
MSQESARVAAIATGFERRFVEEHCDNRAKHLNCKGCAFELPCIKYLNTMLLYDGCGVVYTRDAHVIAKAIFEISNARTIEEADAILSAVPTNGKL